MAEQRRQVPATGSLTTGPAVEPRAGGGQVGGGPISSRRISVELDEQGLRIQVSGRAGYGTQGRRTAVSLDARLTPEQEDQLRKLLTEIGQAEDTRLGNRLRYDTLVAHQVAIEAGEEPGPEEV